MDGCHEGVLLRRRQPAAESREPFGNAVPERHAVIDGRLDRQRSV
jgi:hypothetical protein